MVESDLYRRKGVRVRWGREGGRLQSLDRVFYWW